MLFHFMFTLHKTLQLLRSSINSVNIHIDEYFILYQQKIDIVTLIYH